LKVDSSKPYRLIFTLHPDTELGPVIEPYVVQLNEQKKLSLTFQKLYTHTAEVFAEGMDEDDREIIRIATEYSMEVIVKKFSKKEVRPHEFVSKYLTDELLKDAIRPYIEQRMVECLRLLENKELYLRGKTGNPAHEPIEIVKEKVSVFFHFHKEENGTTYYPTFRVGEEKLVFINKPVLLLTNQPCYLIAEGRLYHFDEELEGKKLSPFFTKWNIQIPKTAEPQYYKKFIRPLIEKHEIRATGFQIIKIEQQPQAILHFNVSWNHEGQLLLVFDYQKEKIPAHEPKKVVVKLEKAEEPYIYYKIIRRFDFEEKIKAELLQSGLEKIDAHIYRPEGMESKNGSALPEMIAWINQNRQAIEKKGIKIIQEGTGLDYFIGKISLNFDIKEKNDWFDVYAMVEFGDFKIPFLKLKKYILNDIREFPLPDGKIAIIPDEWFTKFKDILALSVSDEDNIVIKRHHYALLDSIFGDSGEPPSKYIEIQKSFLQLGETGDEDYPATFDKVLRPYQKDGYKWMRFLRENNFGGCLADDMGLGKTVQALALLQKEQLMLTEKVVTPDDDGFFSHQLSLFDNLQKKTNTLGIKHPSLLVMPTSLIHNWMFEAKKWAPSLVALNYTGLDREDRLKFFPKADIILTTYGTVRNDIELLKNQHFNYIILDESQVIKNPLSKIAKSVKMLHANQRLSLSGTPIENSLSDLWSQMSFLNPGLLGSYQFFKNEYVLPIEKKGDEDRKQSLKKLIMPFILRRTKDQVARDLPLLTEKIYFSEMTSEQKELYDEARNFYRRKIIENIDEFGEKRSQFFILKGLMQLRLIANHPRLFRNEYEGTSGKFEDIINTLENVVSEKHKVLVFSQFVKHLELIRAYLNKNEISYSYLTGSTTKRENVIKGFKDNEETKVFLISLKAGGVGLNLTEADYIFMCDPWWNPAVEKQAINRAHRIGQDKNVFAYRFISKNTVEEKILQLQERKLHLSNDLIQVSEGFDRLISRDDIEDLLS